MERITKSDQLKAGCYYLSEHFNGDPMSAVHHIGYSWIDKYINTEGFLYVSSYQIHDLQSWLNSCMVIQISENQFNCLTNLWKKSLQ